MAGLRTLILKAALLSSQFTSRDVQSLMTAFLPTLPITPLNTAQWLDWTNPLYISLNLEKQQFIGNLVEIQTPEQHQAILSNISRNNEAMKKYFTAQLKMLAKHRLDCEVNDKNTDWVINMFFSSFQPIFAVFLILAKILLQFCTLGDEHVGYH